VTVGATPLFLITAVVWLIIAILPVLSRAYTVVTVPSAVLSTVVIDVVARLGLATVADSTIVALAPKVSNVAVVLRCTYRLYRLPSEFQLLFV